VVLIKKYAKRGSSLFKFNYATKPKISCADASQVGQTYFFAKGKINSLIAFESLISALLIFTLIVSPDC
ncbi:hypothetical protein AB4480_20545, partial [Vibrio sp. 10N.261.45.A4]|uniref:hypothetical protein n=1 Tax=Vibrio sp. 10N.261.45.A4 TaxID=3229655 RepID=UPI00354E5F9C